MMPRQIHQKTAAAAMKRTWTPQKIAPGREWTEDPLEDHDIHTASAPLYWRTAGVRLLLEINSVQTASAPLVAHRHMFLAIF